MAANDILIDSAGFLALWDSTDVHHDRAVALLAKLTDNGYRFLTTDYVIDESATLLLMRHSHLAASDFLETIERSKAISLEWVGPSRYHTASQFFRKYSDKKWSFTDCVSFCLMQELNITDSLTSDHHFRQAGFNPLLS
jgi:predicted nucleic acid-binding protein